MKTIALIGECMIELNGKPFGEMWQSYGGDSLNTAVYLARISDPKEINVRYVSALGQDKLSQAMRSHWQAEGVNTDWVLTDPVRHAGLYLIQLDEQGERTFLYWRNQSAARYLLQHSDYPKIYAQLQQVDAIYLTGISLAILPENDRTLLLQHLAEWKKSGVKIIFDSNYRPALWQNKQQAQQCYRQLLPLVDVALLTFDDESELWQDQNISQMLVRLNHAGIKNIVIKQGKCGVILFENNEAHEIATQPIDNVVDTTAAGDAFNAGFLQGFLAGKPLAGCCRQGNQVAAIVIQHKGAIIPAEATRHLRQQLN